MSSQVVSAIGVWHGVAVGSVGSNGGSVGGNGGSIGGHRGGVGDGCGVVNASSECGRVLTSGQIVGSTSEVLKGSSHGESHEGTEDELKMAQAEI